MNANLFFCNFRMLLIKLMKKLEMEPLVQLFWLELLRRKVLKISAKEQILLKFAEVLQD